MKVSMNNIGNYSPFVKQRQETSPKLNNEVNQELKLKAPAADDKAITPEEKNYFMGLYPENKSEITDYHFYQKTGKMSGVKIGSQFDRRG